MVRRYWWSAHGTQRIYQIIDWKSHEIWIIIQPEISHDTLSLLNPMKSHCINPIKSLLLMGKPPMHPHDLPRLATTCHPRMPFETRTINLPEASPDVATNCRWEFSWNLTQGFVSVRGGRIHGKITMNGSLKHIRSPCRNNSHGKPTSWVFPHLKRYWWLL